MAISMWHLGADTMDLSEFIEYVDATYREVCRDALVDMAPKLTSLARNKGFLKAFILSELKQLREYQVSNLYSS